jgi:hypothetical protein
MTALFPVLVAVLLVGAARADQVFQPPQSFLRQAFAGTVPDPAVVWLTGERMDAAARILGHRPHMLRVRYWGRSHRTAWILEEIGKERPITTGVVIDGGRIERVAVLVYRESIGWEVRYAFFTDQFENVRLTDDLRLNKAVDGISGATLSVRAVTNVARLALYLDGQTPHGQ